MTIEFPCPHCTQLVRTPDSVAGKKGKCPGCNGIVQIPTANGVPQPVAAGSSPASKPAANKPTPAAASSSAPAKPAAPAPNTIEFFCSSCGQVVRTPQSVAGKKGKCPHCSEIISIPLIGNPAAAAKSAAAPQPATATPTGKEERKRLAVESAKESTKAKPVKDTSPVKQVSKPAEAPPELKAAAPVVVPVAPEVAAAMQASTLAEKTAQYFGNADPFATLHQHAAPGLVMVAPSPARQRANLHAPQPRTPVAVAPAMPLPAQSLPAQIPVLTPIPTPTSAPVMASAATPPAGVFEPLSPFKPSGAVASTTGSNSLAGNAPADLFADLPIPASLGTPADVPPFQAIANSIHIPAIIQLCVTAPVLLIYLVYFSGYLLSGGIAVFNMVLQSRQAPSFASSALMHSFIYGSITFVLMIMQAVVIFGAIKQLQRRSLFLVMASNFVALLPCVSPMGFPSAVWSLVGLYRNEVQSSFR